MSDRIETAPIWMKRWLQAAGIYNVVWGLLTLAYPNWLFDLTGLPAPSYPFIWQCVGMIVGVYGLGYWIAAYNPARHWPIVLVGLLGKLFGPMGYATGLLVGWIGLDLPFAPPVPVEFGVTLPTNDLIWWVPFTLTLLYALRVNTGGGRAAAVSPGEAFTHARTSTGETIAELSQASPVLIVLLRHAGCTFCKEALADLAAARTELEAAGTVPVVVHMSDTDRFEKTLASFGLAGVAQVSDPERRLYASLDLDRGSLAQLFGLKVWLRGIAATFKGHVVGKLEGDGFQMPGAFVVHKGEVIRAYRHETAADRPDYTSLACAAPA